MSGSATSKRLTAGYACLIYGIGATAWILLSSYVLAEFTADAAILNRLEMAKGLGFVAVTSFLLYTILRSFEAGLTDAPTGGRGILAVIAALILLVPLVGYGILRLASASLERDVYADLRAISELQRGGINLWKAERERDLAVLATDPGFIADAAALLAGKAPEAGSRVQRRIENVV
ncbi:MAG: hypothetical protein RLP45_05920, partial [Haliea sp.]